MTRQVRKPTAVVGEDVEDAELTVVKVDGKPGNGLGFLLHACLRVAKELHDLRLMARLCLEREEQRLRDRLAR